MPENFIWTTLASAPTTGATYSDSSSLIYVAGKLYCLPYSGTDAMMIYTISTNTWTLGATPSYAFTDVSGCALDNDSILYFNRDGYSTTYTISSDTFSSAVPMPSTINWNGKFHTYVLKVGRKVYVNGEVFDSSGGPSRGVGFLIYDLDYQTYSVSSPNFPGSSVHLTSYRAWCTDSTSKIWGVEGYQGDWSAVGLQPAGQQDTGVIETYDTVSDTWSYSTNTDPNYRNDNTAFYHNGKVFAVGGGSDDNNFPGGYSVPWISSYDIQSDTWTIENNLDQPRGEPMVAVANNKLYVFSGYGNTGNDPERSLISASLSGSTIPTASRGAPEETPNIGLVNYFPVH